MRLSLQSTSKYKDSKLLLTYYIKFNIRSTILYSGPTILVISPLIKLVAILLPLDKDLN